MFNTKLSHEYATAALYLLTVGKRWIQSANALIVYDAASWDIIELGSRPNTDVDKPAWELLMQTARSTYLNKTDRNIDPLRRRTEYTIIDIYEAFSGKNELHKRKAEKEIVQRDIINALKKLAAEVGVTITLPSYTFACEDAAREIIKAQYHERVETISGTNSASDLYAALNDNYVVASAIGCFELTGQEGVGVFQDDIQVRERLSSNSQRFPISEIINDRILTLMKLSGEFVGSNVPAAVLYNKTNRAIKITATNGVYQYAGVGDGPTNILSSFLPAILTAEV